MSEYRNRQAAGAPTYQSKSAMLEAADMLKEKLWGWVDGRFYEVYPGGRITDWTSFVPPRAQAEKRG
jgi:hypothetical protein